MAEFKISRIRYTWRNQWVSTTDYIKDDVVRYGGSTWVCVRQHTAGAFATDQSFLANEDDTDPTPAWIKMADGYAWRSAWAPSGTLYNPGDIALYGGVLYLCATSHSSASTFEANESAWAVYTSLHNWTTNWAESTRYGVGDIVAYNGIVYRCINEHTASDVANGLEANQSDWQVVHSGIEFVGEWAAETRYRPNDLVKYGGSILRCVTGHVAGDNITSVNFTTEFPGFNAYQEWTSTVYYAIGDVVKHGGYVYKSLTNNTNSNPGDSQSIYGSTDWALLAKGVNFKGTWTADQSYKTGDVVARGGQIYVATIDSTADGSSLDYLEEGAWEVVIEGAAWRNFWAEESTYSVGDLVLYEGSVYRCNYEHDSNNDNYPGDNGSGFNFWDMTLETLTDTGLKQRGDLLTYDLSRRTAGDGSSFGITNVSIGEYEQLLSVNDEGSVYYKTWGNTNYFVYVAPHGVDDEDDTTRGYNYFKPWKTIRFACEQIAKSGLNLSTGFTVRVWPGVYEEVLPIIVPANVALQGDETRSITVKPKPANTLLAADSAKTIAVLGRVSTLVANLIVGSVVTPTAGNTTAPVEFTSNLGTVTTAATVQTLIGNIVSYINFHINSTGVAPTLSGSNDETVDQDVWNTIAILTANRNFLADEAVAYMQSVYSSYNFDTASCKRDVKAYIDAWIYDLTYTGNYRSLLAARYYRNAVLGSESEDMFYCRNSSGVRNMSLTGLTGELLIPNVNEIYRRPTGGSFVSLDPGWGPADETTWITSRSPYIQNCCTFGYGAIGQKIDGSLHNGGNKSIVSNDFTQIISDGIGAWALNGGRAELVSVFTYYAQIGMFCEEGGIIRATNGNSSYGDYGAVADGNDPTETPQYGFVNNRTTQATIASAFAGEVNDEILILEYKNAGQSYTSANYTFIGSGTNADVIQEEFRDNAVFEALVRNAPGDAGGTEGAGGYTLLGNNAQTGTTTTLTIVSNDVNEEADLLGLRVIITSGSGTGQYGYVGAYNPGTKVAQILKETTGEPGWDHVIPGYPILSTLNTSSTYKFEPRPIFSEPPYSAADIDLTVGTTWGGIAYGETTETYSGVIGTPGTGTTTDVVPVDAVWNVIKTGRDYSVGLVTAGAGYEDEQLVTISGEDLGGIDGENDLVITVKAVSNDSTNSIIDFEFVGVGASGRFVATPATGNSAVYSIDGDNWVSTTLPSNGNWKSIATGNNRFVAVRNNAAAAAYSLNGINWTGVPMPSSKQWNSVAYGGGVFVAVAGNADAGAFTTDGVSWTATTLPDLGDSSFNEWVDIAYGKERFVAIANSGNFAAVGTYDSGTELITWTPQIMDVIADSTVKDWTSIAYGNQRFVTISGTGEVGYSFDGATWYPATMPTQDGSTMMHWNKIRYGQGVFFAVCDTGNAVIGADETTGPTIFAATSYDGINWTSRELSEEQNWTNIAFGNPDISLGDSTTSTNSTPMWIAISSDTTNIASKVLTGARTLGRCIVEGGNIKEVRLWEPGSGYVTSPSLTIVDPKNTTNAYVDNRLGDGVLAQPSWINRGTRYRTSSTQVLITGDGFADVIPFDKYITISGLRKLPSPGAQFRFRGEQALYTVVVISYESTQIDGSITATFQVSPYLTRDYDLQHNSQVEIRERYSQVRITGHDFLDVGSGNFVETNYPTLYSSNNYVTAPENEVYELNGGRVFYTSTDQNGNFRTGELFSVEQASGIVTISAEFFDLNGLSELALGGVRLGGSGAVVREFSTDPTFTADSNNVVPTQRAIKAYLSNRLNVGGAELATASFIAGTVLVGPDLVRSSAGLEVLFPVRVDFSGEGAEVSGSIVAQNMFYKSFNDRT